MEGGELLGDVSNVPPVSADEAFYGLGHEMEVGIPVFLLLAFRRGTGWCDVEEGSESAVGVLLGEL